MPPKKKAAIEQALAGLGLGGAYSLLIDRAIRQDWTTQEFVVALTKTGEFRRRYPGLMSGGRINDFLANGRDGVTVGNLAAAVTNWKRLQEAYQEITEVQGLGGQYRITPARMKALIQAEKSPDEFGQEARIIAAVNKDPSLKAWYDAARKEAGLKPLDKATFFKDLKNKQSTFYDLLEAAKLGQSGLFDAQSAFKLAKGIGTPGQLTDIDETIRLTKENIADIGPELQAQGVDPAKLFAFLQNPGSDPEGLLPKIQTLIANRRQMGQQQGSSPSQIGPGGGLVTQRARETQSY